MRAPRQGMHTTVIRFSAEPECGMSKEEVGERATTHRRSRALPEGRGVSESFLELDWSFSALDVVVSELGKMGSGSYQPEPVF